MLYRNRSATLATLSFSLALGCWAGVAGLATVANADTITLISANEEATGFFGGDVSGIPDIDGDGVDDVIVGASGEAASGTTDSGRAYIYSGATGVLIRTHASPNITLNGLFGTAVAGLWDVNGDGRGDYAIAARGENSGGGRVYIFNGATGALIRTHTSPNNENSGHFGWSVAAIQDSTGDGRGDYVVGAPDENSDKGRIYVFSGSNGNLWITQNSPNPEIGGKFGYSVAGVPDTNNDGRSDYVAGAPYEGPGASPSGAGRAYVFDGLTNTLRFTLKSGNEEGSGFFGWSVAGCPDVGGNGSGDILVGAPYESITVNSNFNHAAGRAYLFSGSTGAIGHTYQQPDADVAQDSNFGYAVAGIRDRSGDNLGDVVIGAQGSPAYDVYVFKGTGTFDQMEKIHTPDNMGINQFYGSAVAAIGDANGDGKGDFIIGGPGCDAFPTPPTQSGRAWIHRSALLNDGCTLFGVQSLAVGPNSITNIGANGSPTDTDTCIHSFGSDVWYSHTATCNGFVTFSTCGTVNFDSQIAVYDGCSYNGLPTFSCVVATSSPIQCNDDFNGCNLTSKVTVPCISGECFFVRVGGWMGDEGHGTLTVTCSCPQDLNGDGLVDGADLGILLGQWNADGSADFNGDNIVDGADLGVLLGAWGPC